MAGYSGTPLVTKLGIKQGMRLCILGAPHDFSDTLGELPEVHRLKQLGSDLDFVLYFTDSASKLHSRFASLTDALVVNGMLWIGWPKKASKMKTDLDENIVRRVGLEAGLVDVKVCAIDERWSGLKFVRRLKDR